MVKSWPQWAWISYIDIAGSWVTYRDGNYCWGGVGQWRDKCFINWGDGERFLSKLSRGKSDPVWPTLTLYIDIPRFKRRWLFITHMQKQCAFQVARFKKPVSYQLNSFQQLYEGIAKKGPSQGGGKLIPGRINFLCTAALSLWNNTHCSGYDFDRSLRVW